MAIRLTGAARSKAAASVLENIDKKDEEEKGEEEEKETEAETKEEETASEEDTEARDKMKAEDESTEASEEEEETEDPEDNEGEKEEEEEEGEEEGNATTPVENKLRKARDGRERADSSVEPMNIKASLCVRAGGDEARGDEQVEKGPPTFEMVANTGKVPMMLDGWKYPVVMDLKGMRIPSQSRPVRLQHDRSQGVGHTTHIGFNEAGELVAKGVISRHTPAAEDVTHSAGKGFPWQASVGASAEEVEFVKSGDESPVNGYLLKGPANIVRRSTLGEISFVDIGGDDSTSAKVAAMAKDGNDGQENDSAVDSRPEWGRSVALAEAENNRIIGIENLIGVYVRRPGVNLQAIKKIQAQAVNEGWNLKDTELALLRLVRPAAPTPNNGRISAGGPVSSKVLEAALCMNFMGTERWKPDEHATERKTIDEILAADKEHGYGPDVMEDAWRFRNAGFTGIIAEALEMAGVQVPRGTRNLYETLLNNKHAVGRIVQAEGFSTINLPGILGNVANKVLLLAFMQVESTYNIIAEQVDFSNFQTHTMMRLEHMGDFEIVQNDGELKSGALSQDTYTNKLDTRGQLLTLTRQNIINDDLNAFRTLIAQLARKARIAAERALYKVVMESADSYYTEAQGNKVTGNPLSVQGLGNAEASLLLMADSSGDPIYATPRYILVPPSLRYLGEQLYSSEALIAVAYSALSPETLPQSNVYKGRFIPVSSPFLQATAIPGYSATTWYMLADPLMVPAFQMAYLDGRRAPTIETGDAEFNTLGLMMRAYWDFGIAKIDYRGVIKNTAT